MRVVFLGQSGPYSPEALRVLMRSEVPCEWVAVVECRKRLPGLYRHRWLHPRPGGPVFDSSVEGQSLSDLALARGLSVLQTTDVNATWPVDELRRLKLDWLVCVGFDRLFSSRLLGVARRGGINAHPSLLPSLRGPAPLFWTLRFGHTESAVTLHLLDEAEDHGPTIMTEPLALLSGKSGSELYSMAGRLAGQMMAIQLRAAATGTLVGNVQSHELATRAPRPKAEDVYIEPLEWGCEHLHRFACGAPYFRTPWLRLGDDTFFVRGGLGAELGATIGADYLLRDDLLIVRCADGLARLCIQK